MKHSLYIVIILFLLLVGCGTEELDSYSNQHRDIPINTEEQNTTQIEDTDPDNKESTEEVKGTPVDNLESNDNNKLVPVQLVRPIDGDTIKVNIDGKEENVRFLLVDTPETNHPRHGEQPFGQEAKEFTSKMVNNGQVQLEFDISHRDKYQRLLAYVYVDGVSVQEELLKSGLARVAYIYEPNTKYVDEYTALQKEAQGQAIGIWSVENYATDRGFDESVINSQEEKEARDSNGCDIKGNINRSGEKIYHMPEQQFYDVTNPEEMFCTEDEAVDAGFRKSKR